MPRSGAWRTILSTEPATAATVLAGPVPAPERRASASSAGAIPPVPARGHGAARVARATAWLAALLLLLAAGLAVFSIDLLHHRLIASGQEFDAQAHRFERFWTLHDAAQEASLAITLDLASAAPIPQADAARFDAAARALGAEMAPPGPSMLSQGPAWAAAAAELSKTLRDVPGGLDRSQALDQARAVLAGLENVGREARRSQALPSVFLDEVEDVRHQVLIAFAAIVAMLAVVVGLAAQWGVVARRERASRARAEQLAAVAEAQRVRAETADREKGRFLGMLSHELLTPLQSIWSTIDVIEARGRVATTDPSFRRLKESTRSLRGRISDLLDFAKMSSGRLETRIRGFHLDKLIDTALRDVEEALAERNLDVHWEAGPELAQRIYSDPARLRQVIDNLLTNAIKYTERGGITIVAELLPERGMLRVEISDTGVGMDPAAMARVYEPFYRSPLTAGMAEGSGLGLAVVRSVVELMGGTIRLDSRPGQGTVATLEVPTADGTDAPALDLPQHVDVRRPVLVVDDSTDARRAIAEVIGSLGVEVVEAADGGSGLAAAAAEDFQAIFLDLQMPDLTGVQVAQRLREPGSRHQATFLALVSAYNDLDDATLDSLFDARIDKPAGRKDLLAALARAARPRD